MKGTIKRAYGFFQPQFLFQRFIQSKPPEIKSRGVTLIDTSRERERKGTKIQITIKSDPIIIIKNDYITLCPSFK